VLCLLLAAALCLPLLAIAGIALIVSYCDRQLGERIARYQQPPRFPTDELGR